MRHSVVAACILFAPVIACSSSDPSGSGPTPPIGAGGTISGGAAGVGQSGSISGNGFGGGTAGGGNGTSGGSNTSGNGGTGSTGGNASGLPCDVAAVLQARCQTCHGAMPLFGAPMPLVTYADTQAPSRTNASRKVWQAMSTRVHDPTSPMPPRSQPSLTTAELAALDAWFGAGAPSSMEACGAGGGGGSDGGGGSVDPNAGVGPQYLPCTPTHVLTAHASGSMTAKYPVPNPTSDSYVCFNFKSPFKAGEQATAFAPIIGDARVIHHWILYGTNSNLTDGSISNNCQIASVADTHITGWAPGGNNTVLDDDVGLVLDYAFFQLQIHYNNQQYADGADASGVAFCTTQTPRQNAAGIVTLGTMLFSIPANANDFAVNSTCSNLASDGKTAMTVIGTSPHMHLLGTGFRTTHTRGGMDMGNLSDVPLGTWSFDNQKHYVVNPRRQVMPGDTLKTTCYYDNPTSSAVSFGTRTRDEMCFDFITVYPYSAATKNCSSFF